MDYQAALNYVLSFADYERMPRSALVFDLRRIKIGESPGKGQVNSYRRHQG